MDESINVEVVYALPDRQDLVSIRLPVGATLQQALELSGLLQRHPEIDLGSGRFGIYARICRLDTVLRERDRVEIYRPLSADPKEVRRQRAAELKAAERGPAAAP